MSLEMIERLYIKDIQGHGDYAREVLESIKSSKHYPKLTQYGIDENSKRLFASYRRDYSEFDSQDFQALNEGILRSGVTLSDGILLFHGRGATPISENRPTSFTLNPSIAIWHARKHRNHELSGPTICIHLMEVQCEALKAYADFQCDSFGHEMEVLIQAGFKCSETRRTEIMTGVFVCEGILSI